jgi:hypothetical protein
LDQPPGIPWSPSESAGVNDFLSTPLGRKWLGILLNRKPGIDLTSTERAAITGAYSAGYERFFMEIASSRATPPIGDSGAKSIDITRD